MMLLELSISVDLLKWFINIYKTVFTCGGFAPL